VPQCGISFAVDIKKDLKLRLQEGRMVNIGTNDVRTYVKELISKEFGPAVKTGHKSETGGEPKGRVPDRTLTHPETYNLSEDLYNE
jgi:hypothetical protein